MKATECTVGVTGMNATDNPAPGVAVTRALRDGGVGRVVGLGYDALDPGFYLPGLVDAGAILPYPSAGKAALMSRLLDVKRELGLDVLLPTLDSEMRAVGGLEAELRREDIRTFVPRLDALDAASKAHLPTLAARHGFPVPESEAIVSAEPIPRLIRQFGLPIVVKGVYYGAKIVYSEADAIAAFHHFVASWGLPVILQRFIDGEEYDIAALGDGQGGTVGAVPMRKMMLTDKGKGWAGVTVSDPELMRTTKQVIGALQWRGGIEVECMRERKTGRIYVAELNPRFPAWVYLSVGAGQNLPHACLRLALGENVSPFGEHRVGVQFVRVSVDHVSDLSTYGTLSTTGFIRASEESS